MTKFVPKEVLGDSTFVAVYDPESGDTGYVRMGDLVDKSETTVTAVPGPGGGIGNLRYDDYAVFAGIEKSTTPRDGPLIVPQSALTRGVQTLFRRSSTDIDIISAAGNDIWLRTLQYNQFTTNGSAGGASEFWRFTRLVRLLGCVAVPTATPSAAGSYTTAERFISPHPTFGGQIVPSGVIYGSSTLNGAISWSVTVPASGIVRALLLNSSSTSQQYDVTCGGVTASGTLTSSPDAGLLPHVITLTGCAPGASTLTVTKKNSGSLLYTAGLCYDLSAGETAPSDSQVVYWSAADQRYIDHIGANELALKIGGTMYGSYHGGHYGTNTFAIDGDAVDVLTGGPCYTAFQSIAVRHIGRIHTMSISSDTLLFSDGHQFSAKLRGNSVAVQEGHYLMMCARPEMSNINGETFPADSQYYRNATSRGYLDQYSDSRTKAITARLENFRLNGADARSQLFSQAVNTGAAGYFKGYVTGGEMTVNSLDWSVLWTY